MLPELNIPLSVIPGPDEFDDDMADSDEDETEHEFLPYSYKVPLNDVGINDDEPTDDDEPARDNAEVDVPMPDVDNGESAGAGPAPANTDDGPMPDVDTPISNVDNGDSDTNTALTPFNDDTRDPPAHGGIVDINTVRANRAARTPEPQPLPANSAAPASASVDAAPTSAPTSAPTPEPVISPPLPGTCDQPPRESQESIESP